MLEGIIGNLLSAGILGAAVARLDKLRDWTLLSNTISTTVQMLHEEIH